MDARRLRYGATLGMVGLALALALGVLGGGERAGAQTAAPPATVATPTTATTATTAVTATTATTAATPATRATALPATAPRCTATTLGGSRTANAALAGDCDTLLSIETTLKGTGQPWRGLNWEPGTALTGWKGVTVAGTPKRVTKLYLYASGLTGTMPTQVGALTGLTELNLSWNQLTGGIPTQVGSLTKLEYLRLNGNALSGGIPVELGSLAKLRTLALSGNALTGCVPNALWNVATSDLNRLQLSSCTKPTEIQYGQIVGEGTYYFDDYFHPYSGPYFVINVGSGRQIKWKSTFAIEADSSDDPMLLYVLSDMATGSDITYDAYSGAETHRTILSNGISGQSDENGVEIFFDSITNSARMESIP